MIWALFRGALPNFIVVKRLFKICFNGLFLGQNIHFDFEVDKNALVLYDSCGAWLNGEYYIVTPQNFKVNENGSIIRTVEKLISIFYKMN